MAGTVLQSSWGENIWLHLQQMILDMIDYAHSMIPQTSQSVKLLKSNSPFAL